MIPQELVDDIILELGNVEDALERRSTLNSCALTSWSFLVPSRKLLFQKICLQEDAGEDDNTPQTPVTNKARSKLERFLNVLQHNPSLEMMVTSLTIELSVHRARKNATVNGARTLNAQKAILPNILDILHHVHSFYLAFDMEMVHIHSESWNYVDLPLQNTLLRFCSSRPIVRLDIKSIKDIPTALITHCPRITSLSLFGVRFAEDSLHSPSRTTDKLRYLSDDGNGTSSSFRTIFPQLVGENQYSDTYFDLSDLHTLEIPAGILPCIKPDVISVRYLRITGNNFEYIKFRSEALAALPLQFSLNGWQNLQVIEIFWTLLSNNGINYIPLINPLPSGHGHSISTFQPISSSIEILHITVKWMHRTRGVEKCLFVPSAGWSVIDSTLANNVFPNLRTLNLDFTFQYTTRPLPQATETSVRIHLLNEVGNRLPQLFPSVSASNTIEMQLEITVSLPNEA